LAKAHQKIQELSWEPQYHEPYMKYGTDYTFRKAAKKDPLKQVLRSYFPMQEEKDHRVYGASDGAIRGNMFRQVQERWLEWQKLFLSIIPLPEISAARSMPMLFHVVPNPELHNGQAIQMIDEVRHSTIQQNLKRLYMNNYIDPAGFNNSLRNFHSDYCGTIGRQFAEGFITGDAITAASIYLTIVAETAFTNTLFVAMPAEAAANGDYLLPTVFHSVQSDESRHISNGYATLLMALSDEDNRQLLERDLRYAWWNNHRVVDAAIGTFIEYGTKDRRKDRESYAEMWRRWIYDDYYRAYLIPLEKYGLVIPHDLIEESWKQIWEKGYVHEVAQFFATGWLANYWRIDGMTDEDFEWFEYKYPGWYDKYGKWWENYNRLAVPNGHNPIVFEDVDYVYPARCWTCMVPCLVREDIGHGRGRRPAPHLLPRRCAGWTDVESVPPELPGPRDPEHGPATYGKREWEDLVPTAGTGPNVISDMGFVRGRRQDDDRPQPHFDLTPKKMWTWNNLRRCPPLMQPDVLAQRDERRRRVRLLSLTTRSRGPAGRPGHPPSALSAGQFEGEGAGDSIVGPSPAMPALRSAKPANPALERPSMGEKHIVRFEPVGIEIEVDEDQTILRAAAEQGVQLDARLQGRSVRGLQVVRPGGRGHRARPVLHVRAARLREGGGLDPASAGRTPTRTWSSSCSTTTRRSSGPACRCGRAWPRWCPTSLSPTTCATWCSSCWSPRRSSSSPASTWTSRCRDHREPLVLDGQQPRTGRAFEFVIKGLPAGCSRSSGDPAGVVDRLDGGGPLRDLHAAARSGSSPLVFVGGGRRNAPVLGMLRTMGPTAGWQRQASLLRGARARDPVLRRRNCGRLEERLPGYPVLPALSETAETTTGTGEVGWSPRVLARCEPDLSGRDAYVCGPPPMVDAAIPALTRLAVREDNIFYDKFTTTGEQEGEDS
jgi:propane monooxygenase large subunit